MNEICFVDHRRVFDINFNLKKLSISSDIPITTIKKLRVCWATETYNSLARESVTGNTSHML